MSFRAESSERGIFPLNHAGRFLGGLRNDMERLLVLLPVYFVNAQSEVELLKWASYLITMPDLCLKLVARLKPGCNYPGVRPA